MPNTTPEPKLDTLGDPLAGVPTNDPSSIAALDSHFSKLAQDKGVEESIPGLSIEPKKEEKPAEKPVEKPAEKPAEKPVEKPADKPTETPAKKDLYPDVQLPANARGASAQAFATLKERAAVDIAAREKELAELKVKCAHAEEQVKGMVPAKEIEVLRKENEDLRRFRASVDVEADPNIKAKFEPRLKAASEFIYSKLRGAGVSDTDVKKIQELGGPDKIEWTPIFQRFKEDPQLLRLLQSKLDEIETVKYEREEAVKDTKKNLDQYLQQRAKDFQGAATQHTDTTKAILGDLLAKSPWMVPPAALKPDATEEDKKNFDGQKQFVDEVNKTLHEALADDSAEMRAVLLMGVAAQMRLKQVHAATVAENEGLTKKITDLEKELTDAKATIARFKSASTTRLRESSAPADGRLPGDGQNNQFTQTATEALDAFIAGKRA